MRSAASRLHKGFSYERRFAACEAYAVKDAAAWAGQWAHWAPGGAKRAEPFAHVVLDLGCGKGEYTVACAKARPDVLFVGFDVDAICTLRSAEQAAAAGVDNAVFLLVEDPFAAAEDGQCALAGASGAGGVPALAPIDAHARAQPRARQRRTARARRPSLTWRVRSLRASWRASS